MKKIKGAPNWTLKAKRFNVIDGFTLGAWARCIHCREMTRTRVRGTLNPEHMLCRREAFFFDAVGHPRPGPNRHDHKRAGTVSDGAWRPGEYERVQAAMPQPRQFTPDEIADFKASMALFPRVGGFR